MLDRVATEEALEVRGVHFNDRNCVLCGDLLECSRLLMVKCAYARLIWAVVFRWVRLQSSRNLEPAQEILGFIHEQK